MLDILREISWCVLEPTSFLKIYAMSLLIDEPEGRRTVVGLYGSD